MNLKDQYQKAKGRNVTETIIAGILGITIFCAILAAILFGINMLWNFVGPKFGLPVLNYGEFVGAYALVKLLSAMLSVKIKTNRG